MLGLTSSTSTKAYDKFRHTYRKDNAEDSQSYAERYALFQANIAEIEAHNAKKLSWRMGINKFADYTEAELKGQTGYTRKGGRWSQTSDGGSSSFLQTAAESGPKEVSIGNVKLEDLSNRSVDWTKTMNFSNYVHNQGGCGSCWAHAAVAVLEAHAELALGQKLRLSTQEVIDCTPNVNKCGGDGACDGNTAELGLDQVLLHGIASGVEGSSSYTGSPGKCVPNAPDALKITGFVRLPTNSPEHMLHTLVNVGPVAVSMDATTAKLHRYSNGIFHGCKRDAEVDHAVVALGFGHDDNEPNPSTGKPGMAYYLVKNSWGHEWGERGNFRIQRHTTRYSGNDWNDLYCGTDHKPEVGVYCKDHPKTVPVCGMCGILSDSTYPLMAKPQSTPAASTLMQLAAREKRTQSKPATSSFLSMPVMSKPVIEHAVW